MRFTPTRVGTDARTASRSPRRRRFTPTRVGHAMFECRRCHERLGSPPRAWGQRHRMCHDVTVRGSPPRAWGQPRYGLRCAAGPVHPHARGDAFVGSSISSELRTVHPHARGDDCALRELFAARARFTPTRVGTTSPTEPARRHRAVHPHARGDDVSLADLTLISPGSPPRAWGHAHAGLRRWPLTGSPPRAWGTTSDRPTIDRLHGSPPRAWGHDRTACPGLARSVHPHARGDTRCRHGAARRVCHGSPPRAWGQTSQDPARRPSQPRFTPTRVGTARRR